MTRTRFITQSALLLACLLASMWVDALPPLTKERYVTAEGSVCAGPWFAGLVDQRPGTYGTPCRKVCEYDGGRITRVVGITEDCP